MPAPRDNDSRKKREPPRNMHDDVELWEDTCVCQPEPRWQAVADEAKEEEHPRQQHEEGDEQLGA